MLNGELHRFYLIREVNCSHSGGWDLAGIEKHDRLRIGLAFITDAKPGEAGGRWEIHKLTKTDICRWDGDVYGMKWH